MMHIAGIASPDSSGRLQLDRAGQLRFGTNSPHAEGYFWLIGPLFNEYALRDAGVEIFSINVMFALHKDDLVSALDDLSRLELEIKNRPTMWREYLGETHVPGQPPMQRKPLLFRSKALKIIQRLRGMIDSALRSGRLVAYGNGVCYRYLANIALPDGAEEYS